MNKYVITGSLGNISKPIIQNLVRAGHAVTVVTSNPQNIEAVEALGAKAAVGSVQDLAFVKATFADADVVYTMIPPNFQTTDWRAFQNQIGQIYADAIRDSKVKYVVNLSSVGAHLGNGAGPIDGLADFEKTLNDIDGVNVINLRPVFFYYNLFGQIDLLKGMNIFGANYGANNEKIALVHTDDIANAATEKLLNLDFEGKTHTYVSSDERTGSEIAQVLGNAVGKTAPWVEFSDADAKNGMLGAGLSETHAEGYTQMGKGIRTGAIQEDYWKSQPVRGAVKLEDFAQAFAGAYNA